MLNNTLINFASLMLALGTFSCGQDPAFNDLKKSDESSATGPATPKGSSENAQGVGNIDNFGKSRGGVVGGITGKGPAAGGGTPDDPIAGNGGSGSGGNNGNGGGGRGGNDSNEPIDPGGVVIPGLSDNDNAQVRKCLLKFSEPLPFGNDVTVRKLISINVNGYGIPIIDTVRTDKPELVLIYAAVNVGGAVTYDLLNPNAYYCMMVNVNVNTDLDINLHCNSRLADSLVNVGVGSTMTGDTARIGVHVNSTVTINTVRPEGDECVR